MADARQVNHLEHLADSASLDPIGLRYPQQMVEAPEAAIGAEAFEQRPNPRQRLTQLRIHELIDAGKSLVGPSQPEDDSHCCRLTCSIRAKEGRDLAGTDREGQLVDGNRSPVPLG